MSTRLRRGLATALIAIQLVGCAAPSELNFSNEGAGVASGVNPEVSAYDDGIGSADAYDDSDALGLDGAIDATDDGGADGADGSADGATQTAVESAFGRLMDEWTNCFHRPLRCDVAQLTAPESPERERLIESLSFYATEKMRTKPDEGRLQWGIESLTLTTNDRARLVTCEYDTRIFFDASMADTEIGDIIFDTTVWTRRVEWTLARTNDTWNLWSRRIDRRSPVARFCTP
jgi:hypothetical protein